MRMIRQVAASAVALGLTLGMGTAALAQADLVTNGGFEITSGLGQPGYNVTLAGWSTTGYNFLFGSTSGDTGVTGQDGTLKLWGPANGSDNGLIASPQGGNYIAADGAYLVAPITQEITGLTVGHTYQLSFDFAGAQQNGFDGPNTEQWAATLGLTTQYTAVLDNASHGFTGWQPEAFNYTATSTSELLSFLAIGTPTGVPPFSLLDGVTLFDTTPPSAATPEPGALASAFAGVFVLGAFARRRRSVKK